MRPTVTAILILATIFTVSPPTRAAQPEEPKKPTVIKVYSVEDLFRRYTDHPLTEVRSEPTTRPTAVDQGSLEELAHIVQALVRHDDWVDNGGSIARLVINQETFIISAPEDMHKEVEALIAQMRTQRSSAALVSVQAHWVVVKAEELDALVKGAGGKALIEITDDAMNLFKVTASGRTTAFAGQLTHVQSQMTRSYIHSIEPVVATSAVGYSVDVREALTTAALEVRVDLSNDQKFATVNLLSRMSESQVMDAKGGDALEPAGSIQPRVSGELSSRTTVRIPVGKRMLIGGMTFPRSASGTVTCLVIQVNASE